jgi:hypothetical protein
VKPAQEDAGAPHLMKRSVGLTATVHRSPQFH